MSCALFVLVSYVVLPIVAAAPLRGAGPSGKAASTARTIELGDILPANMLADVSKKQPAAHDTLDPLMPAETRRSPSVEMDADINAAQQSPMKSAAAAKSTESPAPAPGPAYAHGSAEDESQMISKWFTWEFWRLMVLCTLTLLFFTEIVGSCVDFFKPFKHSLVVDSGVFCVQMLCFMLVAAIFSSPVSAGVHCTRTLATVMAPLSLLVFLGSVGMYFQKMSPQMRHVADDLGHLFKPFSRIVIVFLILNGVLEESASDWGEMVMIGSCILLGIAFAMAGVVKDIICYMFIRLDDYFTEEDFIYHHGVLHRVNHIHWRYTETYCLATRSITYIPNSEIACNAVNNQSRDDARIVEKALPLPSGIPAESLEAIVRAAWALLNSVEEAGFTAQNGQQCDCQFEVGKCIIWIDNVQPCPGSKEFACWNLQLRLAGKYRFSKPPKWMSTTDEPAPEKRQLDWMPIWNFQVEWFMLELKKLIDSNSKA
eukprot:gnl/MRDRNA2_/MRDRNA2_129315_c0_seq1.p1 gnl/MRDRNA2_/MRDRNA2_129315_c0~~gnl/MRDRNA2_/MRDRNA2_129315_c0_seq1.p1  ORF type:complete len:484 (-),score=79.35 gnl/MRDRNA2_/MRDRNA2_129315_c0_seq1:234-1685(-)